jgi:hypothetical protein
MSAGGWAARVRAATVTVKLSETAKGRGVLVPGGFVLTAMHCIGWEGTAGSVPSDHHPVLVEANGHRFHLQPHYADVVSDMAALGELDKQVFWDDGEAFEEWQAMTQPVALSSWTPRLRIPRSLRRLLSWTPQSRRRRSLSRVQAPEPRSLSVRFLSNLDEWSPGRVHYGAGGIVDGCVGFEADSKVDSGMSGAPVVDHEGRLVGVVSRSLGGRTHGVIPLAHAALPWWIVDRINRGNHA